MSADFRLVQGVLVERVGDDVVVLIPGRDEFLRFSGDHANTLKAILRGNTGGVDAEVVDQLVRFGVVIAPGVSRRGLIRAGAIGAGAGVAIMAIPSVAAASSIRTPSIQWTELRGWFFDYGNGSWGFEVGEGYVPDTGFISPLPSTDSAHLSSLSLPLGPNQSLELPVDNFVTSGNRFIAWWDRDLSIYDPGEEVVGEFTWEVPGEEVRYYRVTFRDDWTD